MSRTHKQPYDLTEHFQLLSGPEYPPEYRLIIAVLLRAVLDFTDTKGPCELREEARVYLFASSTDPFSVWWIFEQVFDDPQPVYDRFIRQMKTNPQRPKGMAFRPGWK